MKAHASGMQVTAIKPGTSAEDSDFEIGDIITITDDGENQFLLAGFPWHLALEKLMGLRLVDGLLPFCFASHRLVTDISVSVIVRPW